MLTGQDTARGPAVLGTDPGVEVDRACHEQTRRAYREQDETDGDQEPECGFCLALGGTYGWICDCGSLNHSCTFVHSYRDSQVVSEETPNA